MATQPLAADASMPTIIGAERPCSRMAWGIFSTAAAAIDILSDRARWQQMSTLAARDARERFAIDDIVEQYESFYDLALTLRSQALPSTTLP